MVKNITHVASWRNMIMHQSDYKIINQANPFVNCTGYWGKWQKKLVIDFAMLK